MDLENLDMKLRVAVVQIINELVESCRDLNSDKITEGWFCEQIFRIVDLNLLSKDEVAELIGHRDVTFVDKIIGKHLSDKEPNWWLLWSKTKYAHRILNLVLGIAFKYKLSYELAFFVQGTHVNSEGGSILEVIRSKITVIDVPKPLPDWHVELEVCEWFQNLSARAKSGLEYAGCRTIGDVLQKSEGILLRKPNFGRRSLDEIIEALRTQGYTLNSLTHDTFLAHLEKVNKQGVDEVEL